MSMDDYLVGWPDANNFAPLLFTFQSVSLLKSAVILFIDLKSVFSTLTSVWNCTVWKFHDISITQILREINFGDSTRAKSAVLTHLEALNFEFYELLHFLKAEMY